MDINSMYISELTEYANQQGWPKFRAKQLYEWLNKKHVTSTDMMVNIPKNIRDSLELMPGTRMIIFTDGNNILLKLTSLSESFIFKNDVRNIFSF